MTSAPVPPDMNRRRLATRIRLPRQSGKISAVVLLTCFALSAALIPMAAHLPIWLDFEIVLGFWWLVWFGTLARMLYTGQRVTDDFQMHQPRSWLPRRDKTVKASASSGGWWDGFFWGSTIGDSEGVAAGCMIVLGLILLFFSLWILIEFAIPVVAFLLYFLIRGMLARVVNDHHHCRGRLLRAVSWGGLWATVYTGPLAGLVWLVHVVHTKGLLAK